MKVVVQRVKKSSVKVSKKVVGQIDNGLLIFVGFTHNDTVENIDYIVNKIVNLRIFDDEFGVMNKSILDLKYSVLSISQFTLYGNCKKGNRPSYVEALNGDEAKKLYDIFNQKLKEYVNVQTGVFKSDMEVSLINDGPVTIIIER